MIKINQEINTLENFLQWMEEHTSYEITYPVGPDDYTFETSYYTVDSKSVVEEYKDYLEGCFL